MCLELQMDKLNLLQQVFPQNDQYAQDLRDIQIEATSEDTEEEKQRREAAEQRVMLVVLQHGELIGHGDRGEYKSQLLRGGCIRTSFHRNVTKFAIIFVMN